MLQWKACLIFLTLLFLTLVISAIGTSSSAESLSTTTSGLSENASSMTTSSAAQLMQQISWNPKNFSNAVRELVGIRSFIIYDISKFFGHVLFHFDLL